MKDQIKSKVLIIPSWYPTEKRPIEGSFFQDQALAMKHLYDIKIFNPQRKEAGRLLKLFNTILFIFKIKPAIEFVEDNISTDPEKFSFHYTDGIARLKLDEKILMWHSKAAFEKIIETGWKPDLIHAQCTTLGGIISYCISKKHKIPYIITEHTAFLLYLYSNEIRSLIKSALENARIVLSVSEHQQRMILMHDINCNPVVIGNMIDENVFNIVPKKHSIFTILHITDASYIKDNVTFFKAVKMFQQKSKEHFTVKLLVRSTNSDQTKLFYILVNDYNLKNYIEIINNVERDKIVNYFQDSDVLVSTSLAETFGISMCEALFCGIPIISTANGGVDEMISGENGIKVNIKDEVAICDALLKIMNKEIIFNPQEVRNSVINKFSKDVFTKKMDKIYRSAINAQ